MIELGMAELLFQSGESRGDYMHNKISVFIVSNKCKFCVVNFSSNIIGYLVDIKKKKWGEKLEMDGTSFNKYHAGEPDKDCVYGKLEPGQSSPQDHMWEALECDKADKYLTLCQELLCECINFVQKLYGWKGGSRMKETYSAFCT